MKDNNRLKIAIQSPVDYYNLLPGTPAIVRRKNVQLKTKTIGFQQNEDIDFSGFMLCHAKLNF